MERLTKRINGVCVYVGPGCKYPSTGEIPAELTIEHVRAVLRRLASYEDTGLEPEEIAAALEAQKTVAREEHKGEAEAFVPETADGICCGK